MAALDSYLDKRDFSATPEPSAAGISSPVGLRYSIQNHRATRLHWDLRLEWEGVLLSWAITRGPSFEPSEKRLAVRTEDHPLSYLDFEGEIPKGHYGAGTVMLWDLGWWQPLDPVARGLAKGHLHFRLHGRRMTGDWNLIRMKGRKAADAKRENWLLIKVDDEVAGAADPVAHHTVSVTTGRDFTAIEKAAPPVVTDRKAKRPAPVPVQLATLAEDLADVDSHWHELKLDGYRALIALGKGGPRVFTRNGHDWTDKFADLLPAFDDLACDSALIDGEIVAGAGLQGFGALQDAIGAGGPFRFVAFDLLRLGRKDLRRLPLAERRVALEKLCEDLPQMGAITLSPVIHGDAAEAFVLICGAGGEGLIAKRRDAPYQSGRNSDWTKIKCRRRGEFVIIGWQRSDSRARPFASLLLAARREGELVYMGKVGTGFDGDTLQDLAAAMRPLQRKTPAVKPAPAGLAGVTWLTPRLVAEIDFAETTAQGRLRHAVFLGLREDKPAETIEVETPAPSGDRQIIADIALSSSDRVIFDKPRLTKADLAEYYARAAPLMLPQLADRPVSLLRLPEGMGGERFFQKHPGKGFPNAIRTVDIESSSGEVAAYAYLTDASGIVGAVQMGSVELHIWGARRDRLDRPDRMVFDLDPDEGLGFTVVREAAQKLHDLLLDLGLDSWPLLSGGKGVHVIVPLRRSVGWDTCRLFSQGVAALMSQQEPDRFTAALSKSRRKRRIFIDWMRNERGSTAIAPFSIRARPGAPVACPVTWTELGKTTSAAVFSTEAALRRGWGGLTPPPPQSLTSKIIDRMARLAGAG